MKPWIFASFAVLLAAPTFATQTKGLPNTDQLLLDTAPDAPAGMKETARAARLTPIRYASPIVLQTFKDRSLLSTTASLCILTWSFPSAQFRFPGRVTLMWGVYESPMAAKLGALSRTWGPKARPPKPSLASGSFSGRSLGSQCWHSSDGAPASIVACQGRIVVQAVETPPSKLTGRSVTFAPIKRQSLALIESLARKTIAKTVAFLATHK
ncbi:MAG: hypothetical protein P4L46_14530 [Fimbriimonas sp.]|nr:hypothetical protein [Fimbriimonas sp.]